MLFNRDRVQPVVACRPNVSGFTLLELLVTVAIAAIVMSLAIPSFQETIKNNRLTATVNELVAALNKARSESVTRGQRISICKSADGQTCAATGDWSQGWIIFTNQVVNNSIVDPGETILNIQGAMNETITIVGSAGLVSIFSYLASGTITSTGTIAVCDDRVGNFGKTITFVVTGRSVVSSGNPCP